MCGIAALARVDGGDLTPAVDATVRRISRCVAHRGPDAETLVRDGPVALAFRRLSLVDPVGGGQPLVSPDEQVTLIANGEVYNHRELEAALPHAMRTGSDCEVLVHLYQRDGARFLDGVRGMFALILWDRSRGRLVLARDRFGIKPLYFHQNGERLVVASEIKALFEDPDCPRELDWSTALRDQAITLSPHLSQDAPVTWFKGIEMVPAGTIIEIDLRDGRRTTHRYWSLPADTGYADASPEELTRRYGELLASAVADCMMADVEIGLFLSGGVDSSAVAALARRHTPVHTFSTLNATTAVNGDAENARAVAHMLDLPNHQLVFGPDDRPTAQEWRQLLWLLETPLCGPEQYYKYKLHQYARELRPNLKAMLLGQASDEFNGGYSVDLADGAGGADWAAAQAALRQMDLSGGLLRTPELAAWWQGPGPFMVSDTAVLGPAGGDPYDRYRAWKYRHIQQYNLWHEDRTAAGNGVEARVPFLDHRLVELTYAVPPEMRERLFWDKRILRDAVAGLLPASIVEREKMPFVAGSAAHHTRRTFLRMLTSDGAALLEEALSSPGAKDHVDATAVREAVRMLDSRPAPGTFEQVLRVVNLCLLDRMSRDLPPPPSAAPASPVGVVATDARWDAAVASAMGDQAVRADTVLRLNPDVIVVQDVRERFRHYVAVDGALEYVIDERTDRPWLDVLLSADGSRPLSDLVAKAGTTVDDVAGLVAQAHEAGLLTLSAPGPTTEAEDDDERH